MNAIIQREAVQDDKPDNFEARVLDALNSVYSGIADPKTWLVEALGGGKAKSGVRVNETTALGLPTVWNSVSLIAGHVAELEAKVVRQAADGTEEEVPTHPVYKLLNRKPNDYMTPFTFRETLMAHALLQGNGRALIDRDGAGRAKELILLYPWNTYCVLLDGQKFHVTYLNPEYPRPKSEPFATGHTFMIHDDDVFHIPGLSYNGFWGLHVVQILKDALGIAIAGQEAIGSGFANQGRPGLLIEQGPNSLRNPKERREFLQELRESTEGTQNAGRTVLLKERMKAHVLNISAADQELVGLGEFNDDQLKKIFCLPTDGGATYKSITERNTAYLNNCLNRWLSKVEQETYKKLFSQRERDADSHCLKMDPSQLIAGDPNTLADYTGKLRTQGAVNGNEVRKLHKMNPVKDEETLDSYGNPNITTPADAEAEADIDSGQGGSDGGEDDGDAMNADQLVAQAAIQRNFRVMIQHEQRRVNEAAGRCRDFGGWLDSFYPKLEQNLRGCCKDLGIDAAAAGRYCAKSKTLLLSLVGSAVSDDTLPEAVNELVCNWHKTRTSEFLKGESNV